MPTSSSLVTNLPADFNTFGQGVDTSLQDLLGGTTGQVLSKTSGTNMDFTWVTPTDQTPLTTKGDLFTFSTVDARLAVGTNGQTLVADSTASTGLKWATPAGSTPTFTLLNAGGTALTGSQTVTISGISGVNQIFVYCENASSASAQSFMYLRLNGDSGNNYNYMGAVQASGYDVSGNTTAFLLGRMGTGAGDFVTSSSIIQGTGGVGYKPINVNSYASGTSASGVALGGYYKGTSAITSVAIFSGTGNLDAGTVYVYGA